MYRRWHAHSSSDWWIGRGLEWIRLLAELGHQIGEFAVEIGWAHFEGVVDCLRALARSLWGGPHLEDSFFVPPLPLVAGRGVGVLPGACRIEEGTVAAHRGSDGDSPDTETLLDGEDNRHIREGPDIVVETVAAADRSCHTRAPSWSPRSSPGALLRYFRALVVVEVHSE